MKLEKLYSLRKDFTVIGLTGRVGSGCSEIAKKLADDSFNANIKDLIKHDTNDTEEIKYRICADFLSSATNWIPFKIIHYRDVLLLHLFYKAISTSREDINECIEIIIDIICQNGENGKHTGFTNRFDKVGDSELILTLRAFLVKDNQWFDYLIEQSCDNLNYCIKKDDKKFYDFFFNYFENFSKEFYEILNRYDLTKRTRLIHDFSNNLRDFGSVLNLEIEVKKNDKTLEYIYTVAETINKIIKNWRSNNGTKSAKIVIDALKNSLELMYFKEKFSAFYMVATNKDENERQDYVLNQIKSKYESCYNQQEIEKHWKEILHLDEAEYDGGDFNDGEFSSPDTENCIQKSDYHIFFSDLKKGKMEAGAMEINLSYNYLSLSRQIVKLIALVHQPGIVTPTAIERSMQIAYNAKFNSGCISRQVGALVTDSNYTVKAIGWNDVPQSQIPCKLRNVNDLVSLNTKNIDHFSEFENGLVDESSKYKDGKTFKQKFTEVIENSNLVNLDGKNCSFCFKSFHNAFEGEKNQVHTRSLHAEENAMLQISKYGGQGLKGGNLFTTASPCELCSKKAFQLGIEKIYYIDPYPGISKKHILKNGIHEDNNPLLIMFQGAVGRAFHKLYEPFMSYKDELSIITGINPKVTEKQKIQNLTKDVQLQDKIEKLIKEHNIPSEF